MLVITMAQNTDTTVITEENICGTLLRNHLAKRIRIVGVVAHGVAVGVGVEIFDGQRLHMGKHAVPDIFKTPWETVTISQL